MKSLKGFNIMSNIISESFPLIVNCTFSDLEVRGQLLWTETEAAPVHSKEPEKVKKRLEMDGSHVVPPCFTISPWF